MWPRLQCQEGHPLCSSCRDKLAPTGKCHVCGVSMHSGYLRCRGMERLVETIHVPCPNAAHGCDVRMIYYNLADHCKVCPHGPCYCPDEDCGFVGTTKQLVDHIMDSHDWPCTTMNIMPRNMRVCLYDGFNFLTVNHIVNVGGTATTSSATGVFLFLLNVVDQPHGQAISFFCIRPQQTYRSQGPSSVATKCSLSHSRSLYKNEVNIRHYLHSDPSAEFTDLSDGLPYTYESFKFIVPNSALEDEESGVINVNTDISIAAH